MKVVLNKCYGGYSFSPKALLWLWERGYRDNATPIDEYFRDDEEGKQKRLREWREWQSGPKERDIFLTVFSPCEKFVLSCRPENRADLMLVKCVETLGDEASGSCANLRTVEIPDGIEWEIDEYDGIERIHESHRSWG